MTYNLPSYPTNSLEALLHLDMLACTMIKQQPNLYQNITIKGSIIPIGPIMHVGNMVMTILKMISALQSHHYTFVYDPAMMNTDTTLLLNHNNKLTTSFGHHIKIVSNITQIPQRIDELCCMIQIYDKIKSIKLYTIAERESITSEYPIIRV